jgi:hypothetical protein
LVGVIRIRQRRCLIMDTHAHHQGHEDLRAQHNGLHSVGVGEDHIYVDHV